LGRSLLSTGFAYDRRDASGPDLVHFEAFLRAGRAVRRDGSAALDLCAVACGRFDGYWELRLKPWDVSAGGLIVQEAGGRMSDAAGTGAPWSGEEVVASNGHIHDAMLQVLARS
jgi:myo-inositol-1(or 4)-monophosphatase